MDSSADAYIQMMRIIIENGVKYLQIMNTVIEANQAASTNEDKDEKLYEIYSKLSQRWLELYQQSVGKYLEAPQFGIQREALQQFNASIAAYHKFMGVGAEFLVMFSKPLKKSMGIIQQALQDEQQLSAGLNSAKDVYKFAVRILDEEYDDWLKSPEGVQCVAGLVEKYMEYKQSLNPVRDNWLRTLSIPTKTEMADVYKGLYELRKKSRHQESVIREQNDAIKKLNAKISKLEASVAGSVQKKRSASARKTQSRKKTKN